MPRTSEDDENFRESESYKIQHVERVVAKAVVKLKQEIREEITRLIMNDIEKYYKDVITPAIKASIVEAFLKLDVDYNNTEKVAQFRDASRWVMDKLAAAKNRRSTVLIEILKTVAAMVVTAIISWLLFTLKLRPNM